MLGTKPAHSPMARFCHKIYSPNTLDHYSGAHFWEMLGTCAKDAFDLARMSSSRFFGPQGRIFTAMFLYQANSALADFRRKLLGLIHGSILSKVGASTNPGAVQRSPSLVNHALARGLKAERRSGLAAVSVRWTRIDQTKKVRQNHIIFEDITCQRLKNSLRY